MLKKLIVSDTFDFKPSSRVMLDNGFMRVTGKAARTGVYQYLASELNITDRNPNDIVNVYRPSEEVFSADSISSYSNVDVTNDHPSSMVDATTFKNVSVGHVVEAAQSGDFVDVTLIIKDDSAIKDVQSGKAQLSPGYSAVYVEEKGTSPTGESYDYKQTEIEINHVAIVKRGRGGDQVRINDHKLGVTPMTVKVTLDSGRTVDVDNEATATLVTDSIERLTKRVVDAESATETANATRDAMKEDLEAEKLKTTDAAIAERVESIAKATSDAIKVAGKDFSCDSMSTVEIQRAALSVKRNAVDWASKSDVYVQASFDAALEQSAVEPSQPADQLNNFAKDAATPNSVVKPSEKKSAYDSFKESQSNAWKGA